MINELGSVKQASFLSVDGGILPPDFYSCTVGSDLRPCYGFISFIVYPSATSQRSMASLFSPLLPLRGQQLPYLTLCYLSEVTSFLI